MSRLRPKRNDKTKILELNSHDCSQKDTRSPLLTVPLPLVLPEHQQTLARLGWTTITFPQSPLQPDNTLGNEHRAPDSHPIQKAYEDLLAASQAFFNEPEAEKQNWKHKLGTEEGWSSIPGEKEFITLRSLEYCPEVLRAPAKIYWGLMGVHLLSTLSRISASLGLPSTLDEGMQQFVGPCAVLQDTDALKTATMLRLFRYEMWEPKVVAEPHADLGLLSVVVGNVPGLEVWDGGAWFDVEYEVERAKRKGASMLVGRQLERLSNGRYNAGGHRVVSYRLPETNTVPITMTSEGGEGYRFSLVFVLRAHEEIMVDSDQLETEITGKWANPIKGITAGRVYEEIKGKHFNINIGMDEREKQRRRVEEIKGKMKAVSEI